MRLKRAWGLATALTVLVGGIAAIPAAGSAMASPQSFPLAGQGLGQSGQKSALPQSQQCRLGPGGRIRHVIIMQFDNVHLERDNPNVPSDIEQIPALYNFLRKQGALLSNDHTGLISHTANGITSTETGLYPGNEGLGVSNSYELYVPTGSGTANKSAFTYWTDRVDPTDSNFQMIDQAGQNTPAPWVPFTRAGCDFAGIGSANMEFENDTTDVANVFGANSPQAQFGNWSFNDAFRHSDQGSNLGTTDFEGLAIHCSVQQSGPNGLCSPQNGGVPDMLPDEPGGYFGFNALFGALAVNPALTGKPDQPIPADVAAQFAAQVPQPVPAGNWWAPPVYDVYAPNANNTGPHAAPDPGDVPAETQLPSQTFVPGKTPTTQILDSTGSPGFPGFDGMEANNALGYTAAAQEAGVPVTYTYLSDVHDDQYDINHDDAFGPGEAGYEEQLRAYNAAFTAFFRRLATDGINPSNTLFMVTVDEGDHFDGGPPLNPGCNGFQVPCQYGAPGSASRNVGEVDTNLPDLIQKTTGDTTHIGFDFDDAPAILIPNQTNPADAPPGPDSATVRNFEHEIGSATEFNPIIGKTVPITVKLADETEEHILYMANADPKRLPTVTLFGDPSFFFQASCDPGSPTTPGCPEQDQGFAWNHGDIQPEIANTWQGWVGPGIKHVGETGALWTDHTDVRPTMLELLGLRDDYQGDGATIAQIVDNSALPRTIRDSKGAYDELEAAFKQVNAPFGEFGMNTLNADTNAIESTSPGDSTYIGMDQQLQACETARQALVTRIQSVLDAAEQGQAPVSLLEANLLTAQANLLISEAGSLAQDTTPPATMVCR